MNDAAGKLAKFQFVAIPVVFIITISVFAPYLAFSIFHGSSALGAVQNQSSQQNYWYVGASSGNDAYLQNNGIRGDILVIKQDTSSFLAFWVSETMSNGLWGQVGYYTFHNSQPVAFYQVWNLTTRSEAASGTLSVSQGVHLFSMSLDKGTTFEFSLDGNAIGYYDMKTSVSSSTVPIYALSEEGYSSAPFYFEPVSFSGIQVLKGGNWIVVGSALSYGNAWGMLGYAQNQSIGQGQFTVGGNYQSLPVGTALW
ncbi:MAG: hypothetical protein JRN15_10250 [Nitrososphaerota archaeon]|nr:hypothetical protein [Nitrososphaerota archaeon]